MQRRSVILSSLYVLPIAYLRIGYRYGDYYRPCQVSSNIYLVIPWNSILSQHFVKSYYSGERIDCMDQFCGLSSAHIHKAPNCPCPRVHSTLQNSVTPRLINLLARYLQTNAAFRACSTPNAISVKGQIPLMYAGPADEVVSTVFYTLKVLYVFYNGKTRHSMRQYM